MQKQAHTPSQSALSASAELTRPEQGGHSNSFTQQLLRAPHPFSDENPKEVSTLPFQSEMEAAFGEDFSNIRVFLGQQAQLARIGAGAAVRGNEIVFASTSPSKEQVAHELTHVVQHRHRAVDGHRDQVSDPHGNSELEASNIASKVVAGQPVEVHQSAGPGIHRDFLGIGNALGDLFNLRTDEPRLDAEEDLAKFRARSFSPLRDHRPSSGIGMFDADFDVGSGQLLITLRVGYQFINGTPAAVSPGFRPAEFQWSPQEQSMWKAIYQLQVGAQWSSQHLFHCTRAYWNSLQVNTIVRVVEDAADPHFILTVSKYPRDAGMAQSSICPPNTHHNPAGTACPPNTANASGHIPNQGSAKLDNNDLRPEQKLDWANAATSIAFSHGGTRISAAGMTSVKAIAQQLKAQAGARVELVGRASTTHRAGSNPADGAIENMDIARARSTAVRNALMLEGITAQRIQERNSGEDGAGPGNEWCRVDVQIGNRQMQSPALHETGHMLGLDDEYPQGNALVGSPVSAGYSGMIQSTTGQVVTRTQDESAMSMGSTVKPWHYSSFMEALRSISGVSEWRV